MSYFLIALYALLTAGLLLLATGMMRDSVRFPLPGDLPSDDRQYWKNIHKKIWRSAYIGAAGTAVTAVSLTLKDALFTEVGCITALAAAVFILGTLCKKTKLRLTDGSVKFQKRLVLFLTLTAFGLLIFTQLVFRYFIRING